jgi:hypothetical protein
MPRRNARPEPQRELELTAATSICPACHGPLWAACKSHRAVVTLEGPVRLAIQVRRCRDASCPRYRAPFRSEMEGRIALPQCEFGLDVIASVGRLRHAEHRSVPEIQGPAQEAGPGHPADRAEAGGAGRS